MKKTIFLSMLGLIIISSITAMEPPPLTTQQKRQMALDRINTAIAKAQILDPKTKIILAINKPELIKALDTIDIELAKVPYTIGKDLEPIAPEWTDDLRLKILQTKWALEALEPFARSTGYEELDQNGRSWIPIFYPGSDVPTPIMAFEQKSRTPGAGKLKQVISNYLNGALDILAHGKFDTDNAQLYKPKGLKNDRPLVPFDVRPKKGWGGFKIWDKTTSNYNLTDNYLDLVELINEKGESFVKNKDWEALNEIKEDFLNKFFNRLDPNIQTEDFNKWTGGPNDSTYLGNLIDNLIKAVQEGMKKPIAPMLKDLNKSINSLNNDLQGLATQTPVVQAA